MYNKIMIAPNTDLVLLQCPIEIDEVNQLTFSNATAQYNYFNSLNKLDVSGFTYQRKDGKIRFPACVDDLYNFNYCMYRNSSYSDKWFYAFITNIEYLNDNTSLISIKTDVWQTWQFDLTFKQSYVSREHTNNDAFGANVLDEGLNVGEYICNASSDLTYLPNNQDYWIAVQITDFVKAFQLPNSRVYNGLPQGTWIVLLDPADPANFNRFVAAYDDQGKADAIVAMYVMPKVFAPQDTLNGLSTNNDGYDYNFDYWIMPTSVGAVSLGSWEWDRQTTLNGYTPKNKKLLCYPYNYLMISNNAGDDNVYHWEDFASSAAWFDLKGINTQGCQIRAIPRAYKGTNSTTGYEYSCIAPELPTISWNSDYYLNWRAQNGFQSGYNATERYATNYVEAGQAVASGEANPLDTGNLIEGITQTISTFGQMSKSIFNELSGGYSASITPDQVKGKQTGDLTFSIGRNCFTGYKMSIKAEVARAIDDYFSMFGYRTDRMKLPNITGRSNWNYVKTLGCNVIADIPQKDLQEIKGMFNSGVTLWHNPATFLDYSQNNNIV